MRKVHLEIIEVPNSPTGKPFKYTACGRSLSPSARQKREAVPDIRAVTCIKCQLSPAFYERKEALQESR